MTLISVFKHAWRFLKIKMLSAILVASILATGLAMTGCKDKNPGEQTPPAPPIIDVDNTTDLKNAVSELNKFISSIKQGKNFTAVTKNPNGQIYTVYADGDKMKTDDGVAITYVVKEESTLYKIFQAEDLAWHKDVADEGIKDVDATITQLTARVNNATWSEYDKATKTLKTQESQGYITAKLSNDRVVLTVQLGDADAQSSCTLSGVGTTIVTLPENVNDDTKQVTPQPPTSPELTEEKKQAIMIQNLYRGIEEKLRIKIGASSTINNIFAMDYENTGNGDSYVYVLIHYTSQNSYSYVQLVKIFMSTEMTEENILNGNIQTDKYTPIAPFSSGAFMLATKNDERSLSIFEKLKENRLITILEPDACFYSTVDAGIDDILKCGNHYVYFYSLNKNALEYSTFSVKSDGGTLDHINDYLIYGTLDETFRKTDSFYHAFTENVLYDLNGLQYQIETEQQN